MARSGLGGIASAAAAGGSERVTRSRLRGEEAASKKNDVEKTTDHVPATRKRGRGALKSGGDDGDDGDDDEEAADADGDEDDDDEDDTSLKRKCTADSKKKKAQAVRAKSPQKPRTGATKKKQEKAADDDDDADTDELLASVSRETRKITSKRKRGGGTIFAEFASLDALLSNDLEEKKRTAQRADKLRKLREEAKNVGKRGKGKGKGGGAAGSPLAKLMSDMEHSMNSLTADTLLFAGDAQPQKSHEEKFGFVFMPITEPLSWQPFKATTAELQGDLQVLYKALQTSDEDELGVLLWSQAILLRVALAAAGGANNTRSPMVPVMLPSRICSWLFMTMSTHSNSHIVKGCLSNLFVLVSGSSRQLLTTELKSGLPCASFGHAVDDFRSKTTSHSNDNKLPDLQMDWRPTVYDFLNAFRRFGFQDSKRSMSARSKIATTPIPSKSGGKHQATSSSSSSPAAATGGRHSLGGGKPVVPFPTLNMQYVLVFLILTLRTKLLRLDGYDAFSFTMFFLRMQFEHHMHPEIVQLASICIEELLEVFPTIEWRKEWGAAMVLRIAGVSEGLFDSANGWLTVARRLPRTKRGTQLTTGLAIYVLQHRIDKPQDDASRNTKSEKPLKFPIQSGLVLDIVAGIVEDLTSKYLEKKSSQSSTPTSNKNESGTGGGTGDDAETDAGAGSSGDSGQRSLSTPTPPPPPPFDLLSKKIALMDLALQAFLNELTQKEMAVLLAKLDDLTNSHKSTMNAKWHELKTLVSLMHRKYSLENLRVGRGDAASPRAKAVLFLDDEGKDEEQAEDKLEAAK